MGHGVASVYAREKRKMSRKKDPVQEFRCKSTEMALTVIKETIEALAAFDASQMIIPARVQTLENAVIASLQKYGSKHGSYARSILPVPNRSIAYAHDEPAPMPLPSWQWHHQY
jgi:hypothetical protein